MSPIFPGKGSILFKKSALLGEGSKPKEFKVVFMVLQHIGSGLQIKVNWAVGLGEIRAWRWLGPEHAYTNDEYRSFGMVLKRRLAAFLIRDIDTERESLWFRVG